MYRYILGRLLRRVRPSRVILQGDYQLTGDYYSDLERRAHLAQRVLEAEDEDERADGGRLAEDARVDQRVAHFNSGLSFCSARVFARLDSLVKEGRTLSTSTETQIWRSVVWAFELAV